jgi:hypothetical protein
MKGLTLTLLAAAALAVSACGGGSDKPAPGSPGNPLVGTVQEGPAAATAAPAGAAGPKVAGATPGSSSTSSKASKPAGGTPVAPKGGKSGATAKGPAISESGSNTVVKPNYQSLVAKQTSKPASRFTPCNLVTPAQATAILGSAIRPPIEAPQGPTCIYRTETGKAFITLAVQTTSFKLLRKQIRQPKKVTVGGRTGYCGVYGQPMLYVPLADGRRVLSVSAPCGAATQFATRALATLTK